VKRADKAFVVGIKGVIIRNRKILLLKKLDQLKHYYWDVPGGKVKHGESYQETLQREVEEEIPTLKFIEAQELVGAYFLDRDLKNGFGLLRLFYKVKVAIRDVTVSGEHTEFHWFSKEELERIKTTDNTSVFSGRRAYIEKLVQKILLKLLK